MAQVAVCSQINTKRINTVWAERTVVLSVKALISFRYDININGAAFCTLINSAKFSHLNTSITPANHQWSGAAPLFSRTGVQMIIHHVTSRL